MISLHTRKYHLTDLPFLKVIGENAIKVGVLIKLSISRGMASIRKLSFWFHRAEVCGGLGTPRERPAAAKSLGMAAAQEHPGGFSDAAGWAR